MLTIEIAVGRETGPLSLSQGPQNHPRSAQNGGGACRRDRCSLPHRAFYPIPHHPQEPGG
jgi:hypothetical protein